MPTGRPFVDSATGTLDTEQIRSEAVPLAKLVGVFAAIGIVPLALAVTVLGSSSVGILFVAIAQFVFAVGAGLVLIYAVARGVQLSGA